MSGTLSSQILIVEDDVDLAEMLNAYFRVQGYEVLVANWGKDGVRVALETPPDIILLDVLLPDLDGTEVCRQLRGHRRTKEIPIIFLTEKRERSDKLAGLSFGAVDYVTKPFDIQELRLRVRNTLRRRSQPTGANPVTGLPERSLVDERLVELLTSQEWAALVISLAGISAYRDRYGFVAADDVVRAVSVMVGNSLRKGSNGRDMLVGHLDQNDFLVISHPDRVADLEKKVRSRLRPSVRYFYPIRDREYVESSGEAIRIEMGVVHGGRHDFNSVDDLRIALLHSPRSR